MLTKSYLEKFEIAARQMRVALKQAQLEAHVGEWVDSAALKVAKPGWLEKPAIPTDIGIFFSVWIEPKGVSANRVFYNIHALKLRRLSAYRLESRKFAEAFRKRFAPSAQSWPNVSVDFGPQTLIQGWIELDDKRLAEDVADLVRRFIPLAPLIDELLAERK